MRYLLQVSTDWVQDLWYTWMAASPVHRNLHTSGYITFHDFLHLYRHVSSGGTSEDYSVPVWDALRYACRYIMKTDACHSHHTQEHEHEHSRSANSLRGLFAPYCDRYASSRKINDNYFETNTSTSHDPDFSDAVVINLKKSRDVCTSTDDLNTSHGLILAESRWKNHANPFYLSTLNDPERTSSTTSLSSSAIQDQDVQDKASHADNVIRMCETDIYGAETVTRK